MSKKISISTLNCFEEYTKQLLRDNLDFTSKKYSIYKNGIIYDNNKNVYIDYKTYKKIISLFSIKAGVKLINGYTVDISPLGNLYIGRYQRNFNKPQVDKGESYKLRKKLLNEGTLKGNNWIVYHTDDEYIKTVWHKQSNVRNIIFYKFIPAGGQPGKGFRQVMSREIINNPGLKALYSVIKTKKNASL